MKNAFSIVVSVVLLLVIGGLWLRFFHDPRVRQEAENRARDAAIDSMAAALDDSVDVVLARQAAERDSLGAVVDSLKGRQPRIRTITNTIVKEVDNPELVAALASERALSDSIHSADSTLISALDRQLMARAMLLAEARSVVDSLTSQRDAWRAMGKRSPIGIGCALGPSVGTRGFQEAAVTCGVTVHF